MKKNILFLFLIIIFIFPCKINAMSAKITETSMSGAEFGSVGSDFQVRFNIIMSGLNKDTYNTNSLLAASFTIEVDPSILTITDMYPDVWDTKVYDLGNGKYYFISQFNENSNSNNSCIDNLGYCSNYSLPVTFHVNNTSSTSTTIKIIEAVAGFVDLSGDLEKISDSDVITSQYKNTYSKTIKIEKNGVIEETKPPVSSVNISKEPAPSVNNIQSKVTEELANNNNISHGNTHKNTNKEVSNKSEVNEGKKKVINTFLKSLNIVEYKIDFSKEKRNYDIYLDRTINSINVEAIPENDSYSVEILGADNLSNNDYKVLINVKNGDDVNTYTIIVKDIKDKPKSKNKKEKSFYEKHKQEIIIGGGILLVVGLLIFVLSVVNNRKIDRALKF